jgi:hypothetical protein
MEGSLQTNDGEELDFEPSGVEAAPAQDAPVEQEKTAGDPEVPEAEAYMWHISSGSVWGKI